MKQKGLHPITLPLFGPEKRKIIMLESWDHRLDFQVPKLGNTERLYSR